MPSLKAKHGVSIYYDKLGINVSSDEAIKTRFKKIIILTLK